MSMDIIQRRLESYDCMSEIEEHYAIREITQEVVLAALGRGDFFEHALFQGGTCLRIFHGLNRFSEDMDFILQKPDPEFALSSALGALRRELAVYGYDIEVSSRSGDEQTVEKVLLKDSALNEMIDLRHSARTGPPAKIRIRIEVDRNPPGRSGHELKYLDFPFVSAVRVQDIPSLFAGKVHALLCRNYVKGRDWYDFIWYTSRRASVNHAFLSLAIDQVGPWNGRHIETDDAWLKSELANRIASIDWKEAAEDVRRFLLVNEQSSLDHWCEALFMGQIEKLGRVR